MPRRRLTVALVALAAITRLAAALVLGDRLHFIDEAIYVDAARELLAGHGFGAAYTNVPAQPVFLAVLAAPWPSALGLLRCAHALVTGVLGATILHVLGTRAFGSAAAGAALVLYALDPLIVVAGALLYPEAIAAVVLTTALAAAVIAAQEDSLVASAAAGIAIGVAILFRPVATVVTVFVALWVGATVAGAPGRRLRHAVAVLAACGVAVSPWVAHNLAHDGQVVPAGMAGLQNAPVTRKAIGQQGLAASIAQEALHDPGRMIQRVGREFIAFWELYPTRLQTDSAELREDMHHDDPRLPADSAFPSSLRDPVSAVSFGSELALGLAGLVVGLRRRTAATLLLAGVAVLYGLGFALFLAKLRYRIVVLPGVFVLAGMGATALVETMGVGDTAARASRDPCSGVVRGVDCSGRDR